MTSTEHTDALNLTRVIKHIDRGQRDLANAMSAALNDVPPATYLDRAIRELVAAREAINEAEKEVTDGWE